LENTEREQEKNIDRELKGDNEQMPHISREEEAS